MTAPVLLCHVDDIAEGRARGFDPAGEGRDTLFVVAHAGALHAWRDECPHVAGAPMAWRKDAYMSADGSRIVCHAHGARFLPDSGECVQGPCLGQSLARVPVLIGAGGEVYVSYKKTE